MIRFLLMLAAFLLVSCLKAQQFVQKKPSFYTHEFIAQIIEVDTVLLVNDDYINNTAIPLENFKALYVRIRVLSKLRGSFKGISKGILMELLPNEHNCIFNFKPHKVYKVYASETKYSSKSIKNKYRKKFFQLDCFNSPVVQ